MSPCRRGAAYVPTKDNGAADADYVKGDVFLKQGTVYTEPSAKVDLPVSEPVRPRILHG